MMISAGYRCDFPRCLRTQELRGDYDVSNPVRGLDSWGWSTSPSDPDKHLCQVHGPVARHFGWEAALSGGAPDPDRPGEQPSGG